MKDRRRHPRFIPEERALAVIRPDFTKIGRIKNISMGGVGLEYIFTDDCKNTDSAVDIFLPQAEFYLPKLPRKTIYDIPVREPGLDFNPGQFLPTMQCGLQFGALSHEQLAQLSSLIQTYIMGAPA